MENAHYLALASVFGAVVGSVVTGIVTVINTIHKNGRESRSMQFTEQGQIIDRQEKQISRLETQIVEQQKAIDRLTELQTQCREHSAKQSAVISMMLDAMHTAGVHVEIPKGLLGTEGHSDDVEFVARTEAQKSVYAVAVDARLKDQAEGGNASPNSRG